MGLSGKMFPEVGEIFKVYAKEQWKLAILDNFNFLCKKLFITETTLENGLRSLYLFSAAVKRYKLN